jgi:small-conductance mechanosensitive channel
MKTAMTLIARLLALALLVLLVPALPPSPALAQSAQTASGVAAPDYERWEILAAAAERRTDNPSTRDATLNLIREQVVEMRAQFVAARDAQRERIATVREQIAALGPPPAEGATEADEITQRRAELNAQLAEREAPLLAAEEALARAEAIVRAIDRELRARQANALLALGPTPLNPANWLDAVDTLFSSSLTLYGEAYNAWLDPTLRAEMVSDMPITLGLLALAALLLLRGRAWMEHLTSRLLASSRFLRGRVVAAFFVSLSQILVPLVGLTLLTEAIMLSRMTGPTIEALAEELVFAGMAVVVARWLSLHLFPFFEDPRLPLNLTASYRRRARRLALMLGLMAGIEMLYTPFIAPDQQPLTAKAALMYPMVVIAAFFLWQMARTLAHHQPRKVIVDEVEVDASPFFDSMLRLGLKVITLLAFAAPLLGAAGYMAAAQHAVFPAIASLSLIGLVMVLHRLISAIHGAIMGDEDTSSEGLVPALAGLVLALGALPLLALQWGARETDLIEIWNRFSAGIPLGEARLSPGNILSFLVTFLIGFMTTRALQGALGTAVLPKTSMEKGAQKAVVSGVGYLGITAAALVAFSVAGIDLSGIAIVAGALSVGIGFGLQNIVSNFVSGIILLIERPVSEGDWVQVGQTSGIIERISVRSTMIETFDRSKVIVPNADLISGAVTNFTKSSKTGRVVVPVGVAYGSDTRHVERILTELIEAEPMVVLDPKPSVLFLRFGASSMDFEVRAILRDVNFKGSVASELNHKIVARFAEEGIEIPFPQSDVWLRKPEPRAAAAPAAAPPPPPPPPERDADIASESHDDTDPEFREATR